VVDVAVVADVVVAVIMPFLRFGDPQLNHGFHSSLGQQRSTTTIKQMP
jgi:hypothetical protein